MMLRGPSSDQPGLITSGSLAGGARASVPDLLNVHLHEGRNYQPGVSVIQSSTSSPQLHRTQPLLPFKCQICGRTYDRADHLGRHLKSHENARPHKCDRCTKSYNRADLLQRHKASHDRRAHPQATTSARSVAESVRQKSTRRDRAVAACLACIAAKSKCQDEKPCVRCRRRQIPCEMNPSGNLRTERPGLSDVDDIEGFIPDLIGHPEFLSSPSTNLRIGGHDQQSDREVDCTMIERIEPTTIPHQMSSHAPLFFNDLETSHAMVGNFRQMDRFLQVPSYFDNGMDANQGLSFMPRDAYLRQDLDFALWDIDLASVELACYNFDHFPQPSHAEVVLDNNEQSQSSAAMSKRTDAFGRSTWIWTPTQSDQAMNDQNNLHVDEANIPNILTPSSPGFQSADFASCFTNLAKRDQILGLLYTVRKDITKTPSFPSLPLLNKILQVYFVHASHWVDHTVHAASFDGTKALPQLIIALVAAGSTMISVPALWKMGLALQEVIRHTVADYWEEDSNNTHNLETLQAFVISLDIGLWSGFKRKMEIAESFGQHVVAILRRAGFFNTPKLSATFAPLDGDTEDILDSKWRKWVERESFKRLALHLFVHDVFASVGLQKPPLISFTELKFELPASSDLWLAESASKWRDLYLSNDISGREVPSFMEAMQNPERLGKQSKQVVDVHLSAIIILHGFWGQIWGLLDAKKYHSVFKSTHHLCILTTRAELYRDLLQFSTRLPQLTNASPDAILLSELFMMIFYACPEDLQRFVGRFGKTEACQATEEFKAWSRTKEARTAVWHAGQVFRAAGKLGPTQLRNFNAIAVYYATLTLWIYGLMASQSHSHHLASAETPTSLNNGHSASNIVELVLNGEDGPRQCAFREDGEGLPGILDANPEGNEFVPLEATDIILKMARKLYRQNVPSPDEPLSALVEGLGDLLEGLGSLPASQISRAQSQDA